MVSTSNDAGRIVVGLVDIADTLAFKLKTPAPRQFFNKLIEDTRDEENSLVTLLGNASIASALGASGRTATSDIIFKFLP